VAPMDANYRRDKPGTSPMGMDLVPVYAKDNSGSQEVGAVNVSPAVINNLGVRTAEVKRSPVTTTINTVGYVQYDEDKLVHIHPRVEGWIETLYIKASGDPVRRGEPLYTLYSPQLVNAQEELVLALERRNQRLITASVQRLLALQISPKAIDRIKRTRKVEQTVTFFSPIDGVVDHLQVREGFYVKPDKTLLSVGSLDAVWVEAEVFERQAEQVREGMAVQMTLDYLLGKQWDGVVDYVYPALDPMTRTLKVRLRFQNPDFLLKPNMFAQVKMFDETAHEALLLPKEALIRTGSMDRVVLALDGGYFKSVAVTVGRPSGQFFEVIAGLVAGDNVVTSAQFLLDSESSKTSDFKRFADADRHAMHNMMGEMKGAMTPKKVQRAEATGVIKTVAANGKAVTIDRDPIAKWRRPAATVEFVLNEKMMLDESLQPGMNVAFAFEIIAGDFVITRLDVVTNGDKITQPSALPQGGQ